MIESKTAIFIISAICLAISALLWTMVRENVVHHPSRQTSTSH
jgi:hypothetical protein